MTTNKTPAPKYRVGSLVAEGAPVDTFQSALDYAREWVDSEAGAVVTVEKRTGAEYMPVRLFYKDDGEVKVRGQKWLEQTRAAVMSGAVPWHLALRQPRVVREAPAGPKDDAGSKDDGGASRFEPGTTVRVGAGGVGGSKMQHVGLVLPVLSCRLREFAGLGSRWIIRVRWPGRARASSVWAGHFERA